MWIYIVSLQRSRKTYGIRNWCVCLTVCERWMYHPGQLDKRSVGVRGFLGAPKIKILPKLKQDGCANFTKWILGPFRPQCVFGEMKFLVWLIGHLFSLGLCLSLSSWVNTSCCGRLMDGPLFLFPSLPLPAVFQLRANPQGPWLGCFTVGRLNLKPPSHKT